MSAQTSYCSSGVPWRQFPVYTSFYLPGKAPPGLSPISIGPGKWAWH